MKVFFASGKQCERRDEQFYRLDIETSLHSSEGAIRNTILWFTALSTVRSGSPVRVPCAFGATRSQASHVPQFGRGGTIEWCLHVFYSSWESMHVIEHVSSSMPLKERIITFPQLFCPSLIVLVFLLRSFQSKWLCCFCGIILSVVSISNQRCSCGKSETSLVLHIHVGLSSAMAIDPTFQKSSNDLMALTSRWCELELKDFGRYISGFRRKY